jgi:hypothetical protein
MIISNHCIDTYFFRFNLPIGAVTGIGGWPAGGGGLNAWGIGAMGGIIGW